MTTAGRLARVAVTVAAVIACSVAVSATASAAAAETAPVAAPAAMAAVAAPAQGRVWTVDAFVAAAVDTWRNGLDAKVQLESADIWDQLSKEWKASSITVSGSVGTTADPGGEGTAGAGSAGATAKATVKIPLTERLTLTGSYDFTRSSGSAKVTYSVPRVWNMGGAGNAGGQRLTDAELARLDYAASEASIVLAAQKAYIGALKAVKATETAREEHRLAAKALEIAKRRVDAGIAAEAEVKRASMTLLDCEIALAKAQNSERWTRTELAKMAGADMEGASFEDLPEFELDIPALEVLVEAALANSMSIVRAREDVKSAEENLREARSLMPSVSLQAQAATGSGISAGVSASWSLAASRPLDVRKAEMALEQKQKALEDKCESLTTEVRKSLEQLTMDIWSAAKWKAQLEDAQETYDDAMRAYEEGELLMVDMERAQLNLKTARDNYMSNWGGVWQTWYTLMNTCGLQ